MTDRNIPLTLAQAAPTEEKGPRLPTLGPVGRLVLLIAFAFTVMAEPISSVAYAIEAACAHWAAILPCSCRPWRWSSW
jgi:hypothetical protein